MNKENCALKLVDEIISILWCTVEKTPTENVMNKENCALKLVDEIISILWCTVGKKTSKRWNGVEWIILAQNRD